MLAFRFSATPKHSFIWSDKWIDVLDWKITPACISHSFQLVCGPSYGFL